MAPVVPGSGNGLSASLRPPWKARLRGGATKVPLLKEVSREALQPGIQFQLLNYL